MNVTAEEKLLLLLRTILTSFQTSSDANFLDKNILYKAYNTLTCNASHLIVLTSDNF